MSQAITTKLSWKLVTKANGEKTAQYAEVAAPMCVKMKLTYLNNLGQEEVRSLQLYLMLTPENVCNVHLMVTSE